jgi:hypothetical protein
LRPSSTAKERTVKRRSTKLGLALLSLMALAILAVGTGLGIAGEPASPAFALAMGISGAVLVVSFAWFVLYGDEAGVL